MAIELPSAPLPRVLRRVSAIWHPGTAAHVLVYAATGSGKTSLGQQLLGLCRAERVLILDPKPAPDPIWDCPGTPWAYGAPVTALQPRFGWEGPGGGPAGRWLRLIGDPNRKETARRFGAALEVVMAEGHCVVWLDDVREICRQLGLQRAVDSLMSLGRSANVLGILSTVDPSYVEGRAQAGIVWIGGTNGLPAAKAGAALLGHSGKAWSELTGGLRPHEWLYADAQPESSGPVLTAGATPAAPPWRPVTAMHALPAAGDERPTAHRPERPVALSAYGESDTAVRLGPSRTETALESDSAGRQRCW